MLENTLSEGGRRGSRQIRYIKDILGCVYCTCCYIWVKAALLCDAMIMNCRPPSVFFLIRTSRKEFHSQAGSDKWTEWCCEKSNKATHRSSRSYFWWVGDREPKCKKNPHASPSDCQQNQTNSRSNLNNSSRFWLEPVNHLCAHILLPVEHEEGKGVSN